MTNTHTTAHIPDEAVQAAMQELRDGGGIAGMLAAAIPHLSAPCAVEVKELEWRGPDYEDEYWSPSPFGNYTIMHPTAKGRWLGNVGGYFNDIETARAAAQADFERRILSCVVTKPVDVAAVRRQAFGEGFENGVEQSLNALYAYDDITRNEAEQGVRKLKPDYRALSAEPAQSEQTGITISALQSAHIERQIEWCPDQQPDLSFRGNEMAGEVGEACNVIKKLERERQGWRGSRSTKEELASELADVIHTAILCAVTAGIDLEAATVEKFNATSDKNDLRTRLPAAPTSEAGK